MNTWTSSRVISLGQVWSTGVCAMAGKKLERKATPKKTGFLSISSLLLAEATSNCLPHKKTIVAHQELPSTLPVALHDIPANAFQARRASTLQDGVANGSG